MKSISLQGIAGLLLAVALAVTTSFYALNQVRKPTGWVGRLLLSIMNVSHGGVTDWGLKHVQIEQHFTILDVGCGGGRTVEKLAALAPKGKVYGVDYSKGSVDASRATNSQLIRAGRVQIEQASVSQLPFAESTFDLVTAVETQYFWPDLVNDMRDILRVLKPGGTLIVIAESYKKGKHDSLQAPVMKLVRSASLSVDEERSLFSAAGYTDIQVSEERSKGWMCATGGKPSAIAAINTSKEVVMSDWNAAIIKEFHSKAGKGVGPFGDQLMLLTTVGARSGEERISPVMFHRDGEGYVVVASKSGAPDHPAWYHNLKANPVAKVEVGAETGTETFEVRAREAEGEERDRIYAERVAIAPGFGEYERKTSRRIPVMILERIS